ncbi:hypothetical protein B0J12DRAFT_149188 [Macrophomina phaseolina]|uniref:Secreted protein n=1 Tax=Macrophomina phaseolina TaxID=35725 RepID=A0ABQ8G6C2_9PEZI|nr:hypothetical protein B0J12DRAFT_149188 [Macrophomina phaseolina]
MTAKPKKLLTTSLTLHLVMHVKPVAAAPFPGCHLVVPLPVVHCPYCARPTGPTYLHNPHHHSTPDLLKLVNPAISSFVFSHRRELTDNRPPPGQDSPCTPNPHQPYILTINCRYPRTLADQRSPKALL